MDSKDPKCFESITIYSFLKIVFLNWKIKHIKEK